MKNLLSKLSIGLVLALFTTSCMKNVYISTMQPAAITVPAYIQTLLIVDRTEHQDERLGILEGILTGEGLAQDKNGIQEAITNFQRTATTSNRFNIIRANERLKGNSLIGAFPDPLSWSQVENLTRKYKADAVIAIELFDTNFIVTDGKRNVKKQVEENGVKKEIEVPEFYAEGIATTKIGFRMYDPQAKSITDQEMFSQARKWEAAGNTLRDAMAKMIQKSEATKMVSGIAGANYARKIVPTPVNLSRSYYAKPKRNQYMRSGSRMAQVNMWNDAVRSWENGMITADTKTAGRFSYNIAVGYEVLGDFAKAKEWSMRSYVRYGNKKARAYSSQLDNRMRMEQIIEEQFRVEEKPQPPKGSSSGGSFLLKVKD